MTVYRRFGTRDALLDALAGREARRCLAELDAASPVDAPIQTQVTEGFATAMRLMREHPLLSRLARIEPGVVLETLNADDAALFRLCVGYLAERQRASQRARVLGGGVRADEVAELMVRIALSFVLLPASDLPLSDAELAQRLLTPVLQTRTGP